MFGLSEIVDKMQHTITGFVLMLLGLAIMTIPINELISLNINITAIAINMLLYFFFILSILFALLFISDDAIKLKPVHTIFIITPIYTIILTLILFLIYSFKLADISNINAHIWKYSFITSIIFIFGFISKSVKVKELFSYRNISILLSVLAFLTVVEVIMTNSPVSIVKYS